jgi:CRISPR/Cas system type I-B associated protein Csh2 (Cas7 group RAMP superfamily)
LTGQNRGFLAAGGLKTISALIQKPAIKRKLTSRLFGFEFLEQALVKGIRGPFTVRAGDQVVPYSL